jgi:transposase
VESIRHVLGRDVGGMAVRFTDAACGQGAGLQQIIAEVGAKAATFASAKNLVSWVGACPGEEESAGVNRSKRSPKGNRQMRRILNQAANAAVKHKGSIFEIVYRRLVLRLGHNKTIGAIAHRLCELIWIILHNGRSLSGTRPHSL